jgi:hypothetical protein
MANPIQIVLNHTHYHEARDVPSGGGPSTDFFAQRDAEFLKHKAVLQREAKSIATAIGAQPEGQIGVLKVVLRRSAWAKSHRPVRTLMPLHKWKLVGGGAIGEMQFEATPAALLELEKSISEAEPETRWKNVAKDGEDEKFRPNPTRRRSEVGAIERIELYGSKDKRKFSRADAVSWLSKRATGGAYIVDLFESVPPEESWDTLSASRRKMFASFRDGLRTLGLGVRVSRLSSNETGGDSPRISIRLEASTQPAVLLRPARRSAALTRELAPFDETAKRHDDLIALLDKHPLVRRVTLPGVVEGSARASAKRSQRSAPREFLSPTRADEVRYPLVGIIDGGVSAALEPWVVGRHGLLAPDDVDQSHGTFIGGLLVAGAALNGSDTNGDPDGVDIVDVDVLPDDAKSDAFGSYYPNGLTDFFDEVESAVANARAQFGVRVFNFSINVTDPVADDAYSIYASRLDEIAEAYNVIFVVSAGNLAPDSLRAEWPESPADALATLAASRQDGIFIPAESLRNVSVGSVNPPGMNNCLGHAPARYSRRGPGLRMGAKPDFAHVGGSGSLCPTLQNGLFSIEPDGNVVASCGTSYAAPWIAKSLANIDAAIEGDVSRETLHALLVHNASAPKMLMHKSLKPFARDLVGFGIPVAASEMLETDPHEATIVIASRLPIDKQIEFRFSWPSCLVGDDGKCRGDARLTLVSSPPIDRRFGAELVRINMDAALQQEQRASGWKGRASATYLPGNPDGHVYEADLVEHGLKWNPVKRYEMHSTKGHSGGTSTWRMLVKYTTRTGEVMPTEGVPFTAILTIRDPQGLGPVFQQLQQSLQNTGVQIADIRTAVRVTPRV